MQQEEQKPWQKPSYPKSKPAEPPVNLPTSPAPAPEPFFDQPSGLAPAPRTEIETPPTEPPLPPDSFYSGPSVLPLAPKSNLLPFKIIAGAVVVLILAGGVVLGTRFWDPLWNPFRPSPEKVMAKMAEKAKEIKTLNSNILAEINIKNSSVFGATINLIGSADNTDPQNLKSEGTINLSAAAEGVQFSGGLEAKQINGVSYIKLTNLPATPMLQPILMLMGIDLEQTKNQWIKIDKDSIKKLSGTTTEELEQPQETANQESPPILKKIEELVQNKKFYSVKEEMPDESIKGTDVYHYVVVLNKKELKGLLQELLPTFGTEQGVSFEQEKFEKDFDEFAEKIGELDAELWIGKKDYYLYRLQIEKDIDLANFNPSAQGQVSLKIDTAFSNFNKSLSIEAPANAKGLEEIFGPLMERIRIQAENNKIMADIDRLESAIKRIYEEKKSYAYATYKDPEIKKILDDIKTQLGKYPVLRVSTKSYCAFAELLEEIVGVSEYYCVDSAGKAVRTKINPGSNKYCSGSTYICPAASLK